MGAYMDGADKQDTRPVQRAERQKEPHKGETDISQDDYGSGCKSQNGTFLSQRGAEGPDINPLMPHCGVHLVPGQ